MASFWPWKNKNETSASTFEKTLQSLSSKISKANAHDISLRARSRRLKALWLLYTSFIYIIYVLISALVTGWRQWGIIEYVTLPGGPIVIYCVRALLTTYYDWRISVNRSFLEELQQQKTQAIEKFKTATKFDSTQQLLERYGGDTSSNKTPQHDLQKVNKGRNKKDKKDDDYPQGRRRTNFAPPPTANVPNTHTLGQRSPQDQLDRTKLDLQTPSPTAAGSPTHPDSGLLPDNMPLATAVIPQYSATDVGGSKWYDHVLDLILGEDETRPINRVALICTKCRLVNGQAPPGVKRLEDVGPWRCLACHTWNGESASGQQEQDMRNHLVQRTDTSSAFPDSPSTTTNAESALEKSDEANSSGHVKGSLTDIPQDS